jgi:ribose transport system substrate-binding protein
MHRRLLGVAAGLVALAGAACGGSGAGADPTAAGRLRIAVVPKGTQHEFWKSIHAGAAQAALDLGVDIDWKGPQPENDREAQIRVVENFVTAKVAGIVLAPCDETALAVPVEEAKRAGVPTVVIDSGLRTAAKVAFVATDNRAGGVRAAEHLGQLLAGKGKVVVLRFMEGSASTMAREAGFLDTLKAKFPGVEILSDNQYGRDLEKARRAAEALLLKHKDVDGVFCPNESTTHGMLLALEAAGRAGKVRFVGFDASEPLLLGLERSHIDGLVLQDPVTMGRKGVETLVAHLRGQAIPGEVVTDLVLATPQNRGEPRVMALLQPDLSILGK